MERNKFVIEGSSIDFLFKDIFVLSFLSAVDINGRTSPVLSTGLYVLGQRYRVYVYVLYVSRVHTRSVVYTVHSYCFQDNATSDATTGNISFIGENATGIHIDWGMVKFAPLFTIQSCVTSLKVLDIFGYSNILGS